MHPRVLWVFVCVCVSYAQGWYGCCQALETKVLSVCVCVCLCERVIVCRDGRGSGRVSWSRVGPLLMSHIFESYFTPPKKQAKGSQGRPVVWEGCGEGHGAFLSTALHSAMRPLKRCVAHTLTVCVRARTHTHICTHIHTHTYTHTHTHTHLPHPFPAPL